MMKQFVRRSRKQASNSQTTGTTDDYNLTLFSQEAPACRDPYCFPDDTELASLPAVAHKDTGTHQLKIQNAKQQVVRIPSAPQTAPLQAVSAQNKAARSCFDFDSDDSDGSPPKRPKAVTTDAAFKGTATTARSCKVAVAPKHATPAAPAAKGGPNMPAPAAGCSLTQPLPAVASRHAAAPTTRTSSVASVNLSGGRAAAVITASKANSCPATLATAPVSEQATAAAAVGYKRHSPTPDVPCPAAPSAAVEAIAAAKAAAAIPASSGGAVSRSMPRQNSSTGLRSAQSRPKAAGSGRGKAASAVARAASGGGRAASGGGRAANGNGRAASGGGKRSKSSSPDSFDAYDLSAASEAATPGPHAGAACRKGHPCSRTPAVSLPTPRRPVGLIAAAQLFAAAEVRPAQTVMEAQERGELVQLQDDARYAMDGLSTSCSIEAQRDSAVALTEMLCSRRGRMALRADGLAQQVLSCLAKLKACKDCVLSLAATIVLLMLTSEDAHPAYLASVAAAVLMDQLLQGNHTFDEASACSAAGAKLAKLLKARPLCTLLASTGVTTQRELLLITLEQATSSQQTSKVAAVERLKHNLRQYGALERMGKLVAAACSDAVNQARELHLLLLVLENATFTCQPSGQALVQLQVALGSSSAGAGSSSQGDKQPFPAVLVSTAQHLLSSLSDQECRQALHVCLSVLMNLSHQNPEGAAVISEAGGIQVAADTIGQLLAPVQGTHKALCKQVLQHLELISVALGVLINLVSGEPDNSRKLADLGSAAASVAGSSTIGEPSQEEQHHQQGLVPLLCTVMTAAGRLLQQQQEAMEAREQQQEACGGGAASRHTNGLGGASSMLGSPTGSVSLGGVGSPGSGGGGIDSNSAGEASIVEVYCGMLLGFLVKDCSDIAAIVAQQLEGGTLQPIVGAVQRCLTFYVSTGAITDHTRTTLEELLQHLNTCV